jgi:WD40 repeat protein
MGPDLKTKKFNPFPGLRPFLPEESDLFFGREVESEEVLRKLLKNRFITVIGASGSGKSSLIYCGVLPRVKKLGDNNSSAWRILTFRPGNDPIGNLTEAFVKNISGGEKGNVDKQTVSTLLNSGPDGILKAVKTLLVNKNDKVLVLVDQFEELFRYEAAGTDAKHEESAAAFVRLIEEAASQTETEVYTIVTMRSDFIGECAHFQIFTQLINNSNYLVPHMNRENYKAAIEGPVKYAGAAIDPKLVETLLNDIGDQTDQLPVLQHALMRTWAHWQELDEPDRPVTYTDYDSVGTMSDAMSRHANEAFEELSQRGKELCEKTFKTITEKGADNKGIRHPSSIKAIKSIIQCTSEELFEVIEKFRITERSFLTPRENIPLTDDSVIDVSHESLMRLWDKLKTWVDDEAASVQMYLRLSEASAMYQQGKTTLWRPPDLLIAINWRERHKPTLTWAERYDPAYERAMVYLRTSEKEYLAEEENKIMLQKRQLKRARIVLMIVGTAALISLGFMLFAFVQKIQADRQKVLADEQRIQAEIQKHKADSSAVVATHEKVIADSTAVVATNNFAEAEKQRIKADSARKVADIQRAEATKQRGIAVVQTDSATVRQKRAVQSADEAKRASIEANRQKVLAIGKAMSIKSMQVQGQKDLQTLLAYQAYLFNKNNKGNTNDADIFSGLYNVATRYGNPNYKVFKGHNGEIKSIAFVPGKREFYTSGADSLGNNKVLKWNLDGKDKVFQVIYSSAEIVGVLSVSPDAGWLACGSDNSVIKMIPLKNNSTGYELRGHTGKIKSLVFSFDNKYLYSASLDGKVLKWDLASRTSKNVTTVATQINSIDISSNGNYLAGVSKDGKALVWNPEKTTDIFRVPSADGKIVKTVRFKPDENTLAVGYTDGYVELFDISAGKSISEIKAHTAAVNDIRFNKTKNISQMATASNDGTLKIWDTSDLTTPPINFSDMVDFILVIGFSPDGQLIVSGTYGEKELVNLVGRPTHVDFLAQDICSSLTRNLSQDEWSTYVGKDVPYERTCTDKEYNIKVNVIK